MEPIRKKINQPKVLITISVQGSKKFKQQLVDKIYELLMEEEYLMEDKRVNSFDVLKIMSERNMKIKMFPIHDNLKSANAGKNGWGSITVAVDTETATRLMLQEKMIAIVLIADSDQFDAVKVELSEGEAKMANDHDRNNARFLRVAVIRNLLGSGNLSREDALELLDGRLTPSDPSSHVDDRELLDLPVEEVMARLGIDRPEVNDGQSAAGA